MSSACYGVLYDPASMLEEGNLEPRFAIDLMGECLRHVQMKNELFVRGPVGWTAEIVEIDQGVVDWRSVFRELERANYAGEVVIDHLPGPVDGTRFKSDVEAARRLCDDHHRDDYD